MRNLRVKTFSAIIVLIIAFSGLHTVSAGFFSTKTAPSISIDIRNAYYADLDGDGVDMDVYANVYLTLNGKDRYNFEYWATLTLPSGEEFLFGWGINTRLTTLNTSLHLYNTAIESGWYNITIETILKTGGVTYAINTLTFDPPGGSGGGGITGKLLI